MERIAVALHALFSLFYDFDDDFDEKLKEQLQVDKLNF